MTNEELLICKEKALQGDVEAIIKLTDYYYRNKEYDKAFQTVSRFTYIESIEGYRKLGFFYENGIGTPIDSENAIKYYKKAFELGDYIAGYNIALIYVKEEKYHRSIKYLCFGIANNHIASIKLLASFYLNGLGLTKNVDIAINLYEQAISLGDTSSYDKVGKIYYQKGEFYLAVQYFKKGVENNDDNALYHLAICYSKGEGVELDISKAIYYYEIGVKHNHPKCIYNLAIIYQKGIGVTQDTEKANELLKKYDSITK